jgi:PEP-CTERM motif
MLHRFCPIVMGFALLFLLPSHACADALYSYSGESNLGSINWSFVVPSILTNNPELPGAVEIPVSSLFGISLGGLLAADGCSISAVEIEPKDTDLDDRGVLSTSFQCSLQFPNGIGFVETSPAPFTSFGVYHLDEGGTLEIKSVPEPSALLLLGLSLISLASLAILRRSS